MTWNLWGRFGPWREREAAIIDTLRVVDPDVLAIQEVWAAGDGTSQLRVVADALGMHSAGWTQPLGDTGLEQGNAVLSRWPISRWRALELNRDPADPRSAVVADVETPWGAAPVVSTHLSWRPEEGGTRLRQVRAIREHLGSREPAALPPVVMGDLNAEPTSDELRAFTGLRADEPPGPVFVDCWEQVRSGQPGYTWDHANPYAACTPWPRRRLDYVLVGLPDLVLVREKRMGWFEVDSCELAGVSAVRGTVPSDHYAVVTRLRVLPEPPH